MAYIGNPPAPQNITSAGITDGTIVNVDIASDAAIAATKIAGLSTVATSGAYSDVTGTPTLATVATTGAYADVTGTPTIPVAGTDFVAQTGGTFTGDVAYGDNVKATFGDADLQIYHDGSNSWINEVGTGQLILAGEDVRITTPGAGEFMATFGVNGAATLYYDNAAKLATNANGIGVTGKVSANDVHIYKATGNAQLGVQADDGIGSIEVGGSDNAFIDIKVPYSDDFDTRYSFNALNCAGDYVLQHTGATKLTTRSYGVDVTGEFIADSYNETYAALSGTSPSVNCETGNSFSLTLSGNTTFTFSNPPASGTSYTFSIEIIQDASASGFTVSWPSSVDWPAATAPALTATASAKDIFVFTTRDGGTNWYGFTAGQALA